MTPDRQSPALTLRRLLLLFAVTLGVLAMHTLATSHATEPTQPVSSSVSVAADDMGASAHGSHTGDLANVQHHGGVALMCLAMLMLAAWLGLRHAPSSGWRVRRVMASDRHRVGPATARIRPPPLLSQLSVLRC